MMFTDLNDIWAAMGRPEMARGIGGLLPLVDGLPMGIKMFLLLILVPFDLLELIHYLFIVYNINFWLRRRRELWLPSVGVLRSLSFTCVLGQVDRSLLL
jgi:hypothetical protein